MSNTYLSRTPSSGGNRRTFTFSCWCKKVNIGAVRNTLFSAGTSDSDTDYFNFDDNTRLNVVFRTGGTTHTEVKANGRRRDPASWYHTVLRVDTTQGTAADRVRMYINGEETTYSYASYPNQDAQTEINDTKLTLVGARARSSIEHFFGGYLTDVNFCDGQSYGPDSFGETDSTTGEWKPKVDLSVSYGTNGFRLKFGSSGALGTDSSGQSNNFAVNNVGTNAQTVDTADNNFVTMNPLVAFEGSNSPNNIPDYSIGNTVATASNGTTRFAMSTIATIMPYYFEVKVLSTSSTDTSQRVGVIDESAFGKPATYSSVYRGDGSITATGESNNTGNQTLSTNSIIGIAVDLATNYNIKYYHNGTLQATMAVGAAYRSLATSPFARLVDATQSFSFNFGNPSYTISSGNSDANGYGNFEYAVPSGYYALCTKNINQYG